MPSLPVSRIVLKLSGEFLAGASGEGIDFQRAGLLCDEISESLPEELSLLIVLGGGNLFRGRDAGKAGLERVRADRIGMMATVMNAMALGSLMEARGFPVRVFSALPMAPFAEHYSPEAAREALSRGEIVFSAGGIGNPFFSTDTSAALRAVELDADLLLKGTRVEGVYDRDPEKDPAAKKFDTLSFRDALSLDLGVMDASALALCRDHGIPLRVFDFSRKGNLARILSGETPGTLVSKEVDHA
ncbi:MAG: UMP kinase [Candidatus Krumholzibacteria bacterium]|jgi:uridylate kinase|nr:UMP kinase [Candidatus Krumholzibacteria bacterium]MDP6669020.1 UMP kinase [Candidatus Krumholzibacteria bacterium]MDP6796541.1 UMP kinase [Candidatus Krumholzibacteria bacterium]MDP7021738.1 UMP kinase [Candidatus Krumholzibacteria bacterium]